MKKLISFLCSILLFAGLAAQPNAFPSDGYTGIGISSPVYKLQVVSKINQSTVIGATNLDFVFNGGNYNGGNMQPVIGFPEVGAGLTNYNDGFDQTIGCVMNNKLLWNGYANAMERVFRINGTENNGLNYSLEFRNNGSNGYTGPNWVASSNSSVILAWNRALNIGTNSTAPLKIFSSEANSGKVADIFIQHSVVGIGTEVPNSNARLDVNGNIYSNGKLFIGIADATTFSKIAPYSLAVDGAALFTKAIVKLKSNWPDYVFEAGYRVPKLSEIETFIKDNGHLPEMPTTSEVERNGIDLGNTQVLLLKKIEELTLILIEQEKRIDQLEKGLK